MWARMWMPSSATWPIWPSSRRVKRPKKKVRVRAEDAAEDRILDILIPPPRRGWGGQSASQPQQHARQVFRKKLREGQLGDARSRSTWPRPPAAGSHGAAGMEEMTEQLRGMFGQMGQAKRQTRKLKISRSLKLVQVDEEAAKLVNEDEIKTQAMHMLSKTASCSSTRSTR
jgi:ATP-dependent HslUV protease ATP-binding subunit HslU